MKKSFISIFALMVVVAPAFAGPSYIKKDSDQGYNVTYDYRDKEKNGWYATARAELSFLNWKNKYSAPSWAIEDSDSASDSYSMESFFGGNLSVGRRIDYFWRIDAEVGYIGKFTDKDDGFEFGLSIPYLMANGYYDFDNGLYLGAGIGAAMPNMELDGAFIDNGERAKRSFGVIGGLSVGFAQKLDDNFTLDLRYRLAGISGVKHSREMMGDNGGTPTPFELSVKTGFILDNSISVGIRYEF